MAKGKGKNGYLPKWSRQCVLAVTSMTKLRVGRGCDDGLLSSGFSVQLLMSAPVCLLISLTDDPDGPAQEIHNQSRADASIGQTEPGCHDAKGSAGCRSFKRYTVN